MCGRYLVGDEVYVDMWEMMHIANAAQNALTGAPPAASPGVPPAASPGVPPAASPGVPPGAPTAASARVAGAGLSIAKDSPHPMNANKGEAFPISIAKDIVCPANVARGEVYPTNVAFLITGDGARGASVVVAAKWGFPHWQRSGVIINARAETALEKTMFKKPLLKQRCVIPSSGFYEWSRGSGGKTKDKYLLNRPGETRLFMAGIMGVFRDAAGQDYSAFVILTTSANDSIAAIHDRMPVILAPDELSLWICDDEFMSFALHRAGPELDPVLQK